MLDAGGSGSFGTVMAGMEWTSDKRFEYNIRSASMSLGGFGLIEWTSSEEDSVNRAANEMVRDGIAMFIAAGNSALSAQIGTPGSAEDVITVGALDKTQPSHHTPAKDLQKRGALSQMLLTLALM